MKDSKREKFAEIRLLPSTFTYIQKSCVCSRMRFREASEGAGFPMDSGPWRPHRRPLLHEMRVCSGK